MQSSVRCVCGKIATAVAILCLISIIVIPVAEAKDFQIYTEENMPLNYTQDGKVTGFATEVVQEIMKRLNINLPIDVVPWARGYETVRVEPDSMLYSTMRTDEREADFKWVGPLTAVRTSFYGKKGGQIKINNLNDAKKIESIGVPRKFYSEQFLIAEGFKNLDLADSPSTMLTKLMKGRHPVIVSHDFTLPTLMKKENIPDDEIVVLYTFMTKGHYLAFSNKTSDEIVHKWQQALDGMKKDGTFAKLFKKWLPDKKMPK